jgi:nucleoside-diphosphate-sugar epimerase
LARDRRVLALSRRPTFDESTANVTTVVQDLSLPFTSQLRNTKPDAVIHLAQSRNFRDFPCGAGDTFAVNTVSALHLLEWAQAAGAGVFVYVSSGGVYARSASPIGEQDPLTAVGPQDTYVASKLAGEMIASTFSGRMTIIIVRPFFVYGSGQEASMLLPRLVRSLETGAPVRLAGSDGFRFNPLHADDAARLISGCLDLQETATINIAGPEALSLRQLCECIGALLGIPPQFDVSPGEAAQDLVADTTAMNRLLGQAGIGVETGLIELLGVGVPA